MTQRKLTSKEEEIEYKKIGEIVDKTFKEVSDFIKQKSTAESQQRKYSLN